LALAEAGATVLFENHLPTDVPGWGELDKRREEFKRLLNRLTFGSAAKDALKVAQVGRGQVLVGPLETALEEAGVPREPMFEQPGLMCVRRAFDGGKYYFIANRSEQMVVNSWVELATRPRSVVIMNPMTGRSELGQLRISVGGKSVGGKSQVFLQLQPGESVILGCFAERKLEGPMRTSLQAAGKPVELAGPWNLSFIEGGPDLPVPTTLALLGSWTDLGDTNAQRFAGTGRYTLVFDAPRVASRPELWQLDLGKVCQSARVRLNGKEMATLITPPFRVFVPLQPKGNKLEVEVTNVSANRIRDLDRRGVKWRNFYDINFVNLDYQPFDASNWPLTDSGLLGPVTLTPAEPVALANTGRRTSSKEENDKL